MEAKLFGLKNNFDSVETYDSTPILSFSVVLVETPHLGFSLMDSSNIDLFNYLIH